ncbi:MAG: carbon storage regulator [Phycisphaeraceae bacterium]|nr:carbon storage regulator [Phycisphaeraceae bacterium]
MLVITRREGEEVVIGDPRNPIGVVRIASIKGERVRIAFDFPREVEIHSARSRTRSSRRGRSSSRPSVRTPSLAPDAPHLSSRIGQTRINQQTTRTGCPRRCSFRKCRLRRRDHSGLPEPKS